jgi:RNA polymerase sigma factor (TIGR02999 family)
MDQGSAVPAGVPSALALKGTEGAVSADKAPRLRAGEAARVARENAVLSAVERLRGGDPCALDDLFCLVYPELRALAHAQLHPGRRGVTLSTTVLVHELYVKFRRASVIQAEDRGHFLSVAARAMRQILLDRARRLESRSRLGEAAPGTGTEPSSEFGFPGQAADLIALDAALQRLEAVDPRLGRVVELRFFAGLSTEEAAEVLGVSPRTVVRDWRKARAFLFHAVGGGPATGP